MNRTLPSLTLSFAAALAATLAVPSVTHAQTFDFTLLPASTLQQNLTMNTPLAGTFIGNYNATTNPTGTSTLPGLFGGSGNQPIPYTSTTRTTQSISSHPAGSFAFALLGNGVCSVTGFTSDLLNETPGTVNLDQLLTYSTFRTVNPSSLFPSVGQVTIPLGSGSVTEATAVQSAPALGSAVQTSAGTYSVNVAVPVTITIVAKVAGQPSNPGPQPGVLVLAGTLTVNGSSASLTASASDNSPVGPLPPPPPLVNQPVAVPTVLPAGGTANLLFSGTFGESTGTSSLNLSLAASGTQQTDPADVNGDGTVDGTDLAIVLSAWGSGLPMADVNRDGTVNGMDLALVLSAWP
ncbi:MAG: hypothetical protein FJ256_05330 [Phycisphaerae bacterium]|nr:hypothetical protein [Phycisphaerae bacterium]